MRSSRLRAQGAPVVSLFAFQDIIAGISGILIVVVLILASEPHRGRADDAEIRSLQTHLDEIQTQQSRISDEINDLERIAASLNDPSAEGRTKQEITELEHETQIQNARSAELDRQLVQAELELAKLQDAAGISALRRKLELLQRTSRSLSLELESTAHDAAEIDRQLTALKPYADHLKSMADETWLIPENPQTGKRTLLVTVGKHSAVLQEFDSPVKKRILWYFRVTSEFAEALAGADPANQYVVFLIRPSGITFFHELSEIARSRGFNVGYDAVGEDQVIRYSTPPFEKPASL